MRTYTREEMVQCYKDAVNNVGQYILNWREPMPTAEKYVDLLDAKFGDQQPINLTGGYFVDIPTVMPNFDVETIPEVVFEHVEIKMHHHKEIKTPSLFEIPKRPTSGVCVDCGSVNGKNPGLFEYRLVDIETKKVIKNVQISGETTNNIAEWLAIVCAIEYKVQHSLDAVIYSDSRTAISWFKKKKCRTKFIVQDYQQQRDILSGEKVLQIGFSVKVMFWDNKAFGENLADYGRK